jgi:hypothetical protein
MIKNKELSLACMAALSAITTLLAQTNASEVATQPPASKSTLSWDGGADLRLQEEMYDDIPGMLGGDYHNYFRLRSRVWGQVENDDFRLFLRVGNEFLHTLKPSHDHSYHFPDELFVDNLYLDINNLFWDRVNVRVGRQDFCGAQGPIYGAGRVLCDGTPSDTSRSVYMDAIKATIILDEKNTLDLLGIYNSADNFLSMGHSHAASGSTYDYRPITTLHVPPPAEDMDEYGGGLYFRSQEIKEVPFEFYYFFKRETDARLPSGAKITGRSTHTLGLRVTPRFSDTLSAELEAAAQAGQKDNGADCTGAMAYGGLTYAPNVDETVKPYLTGACYYLSGDKNRGVNEDDSAWNPLWSRWPQVSNLYVYNFMYGAGYWSNLLYPHLQAGATVGPAHRLSASTGPMCAAVEDDLGGGGGSLYGWLGTLRYDFLICKGIFGKRGDIYGHIMGEVLEPGDYYTSNETAYFVRWELSFQY